MSQSARNLANREATGQEVNQTHAPGRDIEREPLAASPFRGIRSRPSPWLSEWLSPSPRLAETFSPLDHAQLAPYGKVPGSWSGFGTGETQRLRHGSGGVVRPYAPPFDVGGFPEESPRNLKRLETAMRSVRNRTLGILLVLAMISVPGCRSEEGTAEKAGEAIDETGDAMDAAGEAMDEAADKADAAMEETANAMDEAGAAMGEAMGETGDPTGAAGEAMDEAADKADAAMEETANAMDEAGAAMGEAMGETGDPTGAAGEAMDEAADKADAAMEEPQKETKEAE